MEKTKEIIISKEEIDELKSVLSEIDDFDTLKEDNVESLKELKKISNENHIALGRLYFKCFKLLKEIQEYTINSKNIYKFISSVEISNEFEDNIEYYNSDNFGSIWKGERIKKYVLENRKSIYTLIELFFKIFGDE